MAAADGLRSLLCHLPAVRGAGVLQHRAAGGGEADARPGSPEAGAAQPELRQRRVPRPAAGQRAQGQQVRRVGLQERVLSLQLGPGVVHVLRQHAGHHHR